jgi:hypothetical protein
MIYAAPTLKYAQYKKKQFLDCNYCCAVTRVVELMTLDTDVKIMGMPQGDISISSTLGELMTTELPDRMPPVANWGRVGECERGMSAWRKHKA